ncbi:MAG: hypothetical protein HS126_40355 [Anaerolineales bacterium]|nr:hypothetical protein [Anaerolineales bacterium]
MNELTKALLEVAWKDLKANRRTLKDLKAEVYDSWIIWRNWMILDWAAELMDVLHRRPVTDFYPDAPLGDAVLSWLEGNGYFDFELPCYGYEDEEEEPYTQEQRDQADDEVYYFVAHTLALMAWVAFEPAQDDVIPGRWEQLDYTEAEIEEFFNFKMNYAPRPQPSRKKVEGTQLSMF